MLTSMHAVVGLFFISIGIVLQSTLGNLSRGAEKLKWAVAFSTLSFLLYNIGFGFGAEALAQHFHYEPVFSNNCTVAMSFILSWLVSTFCFSLPRRNSGNNSGEANNVNINVSPPRIPRK